MHKILKEIVESTRLEVQKRKKANNLEHITSNSRRPMSYLFSDSLAKPKTGKIGLIAEIKLASPSAGTIGLEDEVLEKVSAYENAGADAISVITERNYFKGNLDLILKIKKKVKIPILQKDFIVDEYQIKEASELGSDALLLIARILTEEQLKSFVDLCEQLGIEPVVEINSFGEIEMAEKSISKIIAVNARDLDTFEVSVDTACEILGRIHKDRIKLGFSGITSRTEVEKYKAAGAKAILVGTELMKRTDVTGFIKELKNV